MTDSFVTDLAWFFFAAWSIFVGLLTLAAFAPDLLSSKTAADPTHSKPLNSVLHIQPGVRK